MTMNGGLDCLPPSDLQGPRRHREPTVTWLQQPGCPQAFSPRPRPNPRLTRSMGAVSRRTGGALAGGEHLGSQSITAPPTVCQSVPHGLRATALTPRL